MPETSIEWTATPHPDGTWRPGFSFNPWVGCTKISPACDHCYAEGWAKRTGQAHLWAGERRRTTVSNWQQPIKWNRRAEADGVRRKVFCASLADVFDNQVPEQWRADLWATITVTPHLDWLLLTKRPQNIAKMLPIMWGDGWPNVWLGTTVENADEERRIRHLRDVPAIVRFLSCEPLLSPICPDLSGIHWVIGGGESGGGARQTDPAWFRSLRDQCAGQGVSYFHKQMTRKAPIPPDLRVRQFPAPAVPLAA